MRIVLIDMSPLLREIVRETLGREPGFDVVAEHEGGVDVREAVQAGDADFVVLGADATASAVTRALVVEGARLRALEVHADGLESVLYELRPHRVSLGEISPEMLLTTIRTKPDWKAGGEDDSAF